MTQYQIASSLLQYGLLKTNTCCAYFNSCLATHNIQISKPSTRSTELSSCFAKTSSCFTKTSSCLGLLNSLVGTSLSLFASAYIRFCTTSIPLQKLLILTRPYPFQASQIYIHVGQQYFEVEKISAQERSVLVCVAAVNYPFVVMWTKSMRHTLNPNYTRGSPAYPCTW